MIKHKNDKTQESIQPSNIPGMGDIEFSGNPGSANEFGFQDTGSGDLPTSEDDKEKIRKVMNFSEFIKNVS